ncbi:MAG: tetratricopeptide repeat protein [Deltaproteobacteria bacterium]|nr:tetratricopeptide repeat protein [Deltaproteobacteria bacterium]
MPKRKKVDPARRRPTAVAKDIKKHLSQRDMAALLADFEKLFAAAHGDAKARIDLAITSMAAGNVDQAVTLLREGLALAPKEPGFHYALAAIYLAQDRADDALRQLDAAAAALARNLTLVNTRALFFLDHRIGKAAEAQAEIEDFLRAGGTADEACLSLLLRAQLLSGNRGAAFGTAHELLRRGTTDVEALGVVCEAAIKRGAVADFIRLATALPKPIQAHPAVAALLWASYRKAGDAEAAKRCEALAKAGVPRLFASHEALASFVDGLSDPR